MALSQVSSLQLRPNANSFFGEVTKPQNVIFTVIKGPVCSEASKGPLTVRAMPARSQPERVSAPFGCAPWAPRGPRPTWAVSPSYTSSSASLAFGGAPLLGRNRNGRLLSSPPSDSFIDEAPTTFQLCAGCTPCKTYFTPIVQMRKLRFSLL